MFADVVEGVDVYTRGPHHPDFLPTDEQAEVLIPDRVSAVADVKGVVVRDDDQAAREAWRLKLQTLPVPRMVIAPKVLRASHALSRKLRCGRTPSEREYNEGGAHG